MRSTARFPSTMPGRLAHRDTIDRIHLWKPTGTALAGRESDYEDSLPSPWGAETVESVVLLAMETFSISELCIGSSRRVDRVTVLRTHDRAVRSSG